MVYVHRGICPLLARTTSVYAASTDCGGTERPGTYHRASLKTDLFRKTDLFPRGENPL